MVNLPGKWRNAHGAGHENTTRKKVDRSIPNRNAFLSIVESEGAALVARRQERCKKAVNCGSKMMKEGRIGYGNVKSAEIPQRMILRKNCL